MRIERFGDCHIAHFYSEEEVLVKDSDVFFGGLLYRLYGRALCFECIYTKMLM